mmetsp:Transcript_13501/g.25829  ORF Transcript_13501/g.25829 Transcript_13501/m.25829 type:complete len:216 (-) Transcript_13501:543-1190(-)
MLMMTPPRSSSEVKYLIVSDALANVRGDLTRHLGTSLVSYRCRLAFQCEEHGLQSHQIALVQIFSISCISIIGCSCCCCCIIGRHRHWQRVSTIQTEQIGINGEKIRVEFLHLTHPVLGIVLGEQIEQRGWQYSREVEMILRETRAGQFFYEEADVYFRRAEEAHGFHVTDMCRCWFFVQLQRMTTIRVVIVVNILRIIISPRIIETTDEIDLPR